MKMIIFIGSLSKINYYLCYGKLQEKEEGACYYLVEEKTLIGDYDIDDLIVVYTYSFREQDKPFLKVVKNDIVFSNHYLPQIKQNLLNILNDLL